MRKGFIYGILCVAMLGLTTAQPGCGNDLLPIDAYVPDTSGDGPACTGTLQLFEICQTSDMCESCLCVVFGHARGCTKKCVGMEDCPSNSSGCMNGVCQPML